VNPPEAMTMKLGWVNCLLAVYFFGTKAHGFIQQFERIQQCSSSKYATPSSLLVLNNANINDNEFGVGQEQVRGSDTSSLSRRLAGKKAVSSLLAPIVLGFGGGFFQVPEWAGAALQPYTNEKQTIVITGCNSGIGLDAATRMAKRGHKIVLACRTLAKAQTAATSIQESLGQGEAAFKADLVPMECDLASLKSISSFVNKLKSDVLVDGSKIDILALNAGLARDTSAKEALRTQEGFELTVGTNHLGHFFLTQSILPMVRKDGRIIVTASSVHDPDSPGGAQGSKAKLGDLSGLANGPNFDMVDGGSFDADKAYKDSKLCNVFFTRELQRRLDSDGSKIHANSFTPGLIVGTGLFRDQNPLFTKLFGFAANNLLKVGETPQFGGGALEYMCLDKSAGANGGRYFFSAPGSSKYGDAAYGDQFNESEVSEEARDDAKGRRLWDLSMKLVGLTS
jgi:protochlorophyllide reductase